MAAQAQAGSVKAVEAGTRGGGRLALPGTLWLLAFFLLPLVIMAIVSFMSLGSRKTIVMPFTDANYQRVLSALYLPTIWDSVWISLVTTIICLLVGYPLAFFISTRKSQLMRQLTLFLVILPFWTNFVVRTYAMQTVLAREGVLNHFLLSLGLIDHPLDLLYTQGAVIIGLVYGYLPFMVLPIYATAERFDFKLVAAANDLGANDWQAIWRIIIPLTLPGVIAGFILVFIPCLGAFVTPELLGGTSTLMIGNLINSQFEESNYPRGSALSITLMALVMFALLLYVRFGTREQK
ncbi:MAG: ABC transporter permease [Anaerolineae bacterium]|nr:ABC transporter permease [Anaerolineae bacterium]